MATAPSKPSKPSKDGDAGEDGKPSKDGEDGDAGKPKMEKKKRIGKKEKQELATGLSNLIMQSIDDVQQELKNAGIKKVERKASLNLATAGLIDESIQMQLKEQLQKLKASKPAHFEKLGNDGNSVDIEAYLGFQLDKEQDKIFRFQPKNRNDYAVVFALDASGSMGHSEKMLNANKTTANLAMAMESVGIDVSVLKFTHESTEIKGWDDRTLTSGIGEIRAGGDNAIAESVQNGIELLKSKSGRKAIIVLSDGEDYTSMETATLLKQNAGIDLYMGFYQYYPHFFKNLKKSGCQNAVGYVEINENAEVLPAMLDLLRQFIKRYQ